MALDSEVLQPLLQLLMDGTSKASLLRSATWALSNLCREKKSPPGFAVVSESLQMLARLVYTFPRAESRNLGI